MTGTNSQEGTRFSREGTWFGPFQLMRLMDGVGLGEVYEAEDTRERRPVMLKLISQEFADDAMFRARMHRAADTAGRVSEPHIVPIHEYGDVDGQFYITMGMIDGASLRALLTDQGPLSPVRAVGIVRQIAGALDAAHARGVNYHHVTPENILVTDNYLAYLLDFGFGIDDAGSDLTMDVSKAPWNAYNYMAPEWLRVGDQVSYRADIYGLACVLSECLIGIPPYLADTVERLIAAKLAGPAPRPSQQRPGWISPALDSVVAKGMAPDPAERYSRAEDLATAAQDALLSSEQHEEAALEWRGDDETISDTANLGMSTYEIGSGATPRTVDVVATRPHDSADTTAARTGDWDHGAESSRHSEMVADNRRYPAWLTQPQAADASSTSTRPSTASILGRRLMTRSQNKRRLWAIVGAITSVVVVVIVVAGLLVSRSSSRSQQASPPHGATRQSVLPFDGVNFRLSPGGVAVDNAGTVYVTDQGMYGRVVALAAGSNTATVEHFGGLYEPQGVAVDSTDTMYVTDFNNRVVMLAAGSSRQVDLPFTGLNYPEGVAVDGQGSVYVADRGNNRVVELPVGSNKQVVLPFDGLNNPDGVAVDNAGNVYVADTDNSRAVRLDTGSNNQTVLPFPHLDAPWGIAVNDAGDVFVTERDTSTVVKLAAGSSAMTELPFTNLNTPLSVAVDKTGNVYVADRGDDSVQKLTP